MRREHSLRRLEGELQLCDGCHLSKQARRPFSRSSPTKRASQKLELVHTDLCGPMAQASVKGARYILTFTDDHSRKVWVYFLQSRDKTFYYFQQFKELVETSSGCKLQRLRSDGGGEYVSHQMREYCSALGIEHQVTPPYTPQWNGVAERLNRTLLEAARSMLHAQALAPRFWGEAVNAVAHVRNYLPHKALDDKVPEEVWTGRKPGVSYLRA